MPKVPFEIMKEQYLLKSSFFYNRLRSEGYFKLFTQVQKYVISEEQHLDWTERRLWSIGDDAWQLLMKDGISPALVFLHPKVLSTCPEFLKYYRSIAMLPQKGLKAISGVSNVEKIESGTGSPNKLQTEKLLRSINEVMSLIVMLSTGINKREIEGMMYATAGTKIDGSWRNQIGNEGERVIRTIIFDGLVANDEISSVTIKGNTEKITSENLDSLKDNLEENQTLNLVNGYTVKFSSEPDVEMKDKNGKTVGVIEIKAGLDPAAALERLGAMLKSFENTLDEYPDAVTILVASCLTDESQTRLLASMHVRQIYVTSAITANEGAKRKFVNKIRTILKLC